MMENQRRLSSSQRNLLTLFMRVLEASGQGLKFNKEKVIDEFEIVFRELLEKTLPNEK